MLCFWPILATLGCLDAMAAKKCFTVSIEDDLLLFTVHCSDCALGAELLMVGHASDVFFVFAFVSVFVCAFVFLSIFLFVFFYYFFCVCLCVCFCD